MSDEQTKIRSAYGRGFHDAMNQARLNELERSLSPMQKRVLDAVPIETHWSLTQIQSELTRVHARMDHAVLLGILDTLKSMGLVREPLGRHFIRVQAKQQLRVIAKEDSVTVQPKETPKALPDRIGQLSAQLRAMADVLDGIALEVEQELGENSEAQQKLNKFKALFGELVK